MNKTLKRLIQSKPLENQVKDIIKRSGGSLYLPSPSTCYQDSAGTTPCGVDDPVGFLMDTGQGGLDNLGPELVTNGDFSNGTTMWILIGSGGAISASGGVLTISGGFSPGARQTNVTVANKTYKVSLTATRNSGTANVIPTGSPVITTSGTYSYIYKATSTSFELNLSGDSTSTSWSFDNVSVRELPGNHATQATAGFKPILRGKVKNLAKYSSDVTNALWVKQALSTALDSETIDNPATMNSGVRFEFSSSGITGLAPYTGKFTVSVELKAGTLNNIQVVIDPGNCTLPTPASPYVPVALTGQYIRYSIPIEVSAVGTVWRIAFLNQTLSAGTFHIRNLQIETGSTANEYIPTTSAPKSSSYGPYWLDFDGVDDRLSVPIQSGSTGYLSLAVRSDKVAMTCPLSGSIIGNTSTVALKFRIGGNIWARTDNGTTLADAVIPGTAYSAGEKLIVSETWVYPGYVTGQKNLFPLVSSVSVDPTSTKPINLGADLTAGEFLQGGMYGYAMCSVKLSTIDTTKIIKYLAKKSEISL